MKYKIKYRWVYNSKITTKEAQELEIEGYVFTFAEVLRHLDKFSAVVAKSTPGLENRIGEIKSIMEDFIIDVCSTNKLK